MLFHIPQREVTPPELYIDDILIDYATLFNFHSYKFDFFKNRSNSWYFEKNKTYYSSKYINFVKFYFNCPSPTSWYFTMGLYLC